MSQNRDERAAVDAALERLRSGDVPPVPEHVPEPEERRLQAGLTWCMRCGLLLAADSRPDLDPNRKPCRVVRLRPFEQIVARGEGA